MPPSPPCLLLLLCFCRFLWHHILYFTPGGKDLSLFSSCVPHGSSILGDVFPNFTYTLFLIYSVPHISSFMYFLSHVIPLLHHAGYSFLIQYVLPEVEITCNTSSVFRLCRIFYVLSGTGYTEMSKTPSLFWWSSISTREKQEIGEKMTGKSITMCCYDSESNSTLKRGNKEMKWTFLPHVI